VLVLLTFIQIIFTISQNPHKKPLKLKSLLKVFLSLTTKLETPPKQQYEIHHTTQYRYKS